MSPRPPSRRELAERLRRAEAALEAIRAGRADAVIGPESALVIRAKAAEQALRESEERYRLISQMISDYVYAFRVEHDQTLIPEWIAGGFERITGSTPEDVQQRGSWTSLIHPDDRPAALERTRRLLAGQDDVSEFRIVRPDGGVRWVRDHGHPVWDDAQRRVVRIYGAVQDITERRSVEEQLLQAQKMESIGRLAGGVAHDFNNLLTVILSTTDLLRETLPTDDPRAQDLQEIRKAAESAAALTRKLLAFSRRQVFQPRVLNLNLLLEDLETMLKRLIGEDIQLVINRGEQLGNVRADPAQLEQVLLNLVVNSRDAMPKGGTLTIETANVLLDEIYAARHVGVTPGHYVLLAVTDTGIGMDEATRRRVFEPFFTTKGPGRGTGLGLSTVYGIIKQSGGSVWVYSELGVGTTFKVYLPLVTEALSEARKAAARAPARGTETILLVEDEPSLRRLVERTLEASGYQVLAADTPRDALQLAQQHSGPIHLLLTDIVMPEMWGPELAAAITQARPETKTLYMSGYAENAAVQQGVLAPGKPFLNKPFDIGTLTQTVREALDAAG